MKKLINWIIRLLGSRKPKTGFQQIVTENPMTKQIHQIMMKFPIEDNSLKQSFFGKQKPTKQWES
jgi:hypothetical protein